MNLNCEHSTIKKSDLAIAFMEVLYLGINAFKNALMAIKNYYKPFQRKAMKMNSSMKMNSRYLDINTYTILDTYYHI